MNHKMKYVNYYQTFYLIIMVYYDLNEQLVQFQMNFYQLIKYKNNLFL